MRATLLLLITTIALLVVCGCGKNGGSPDTEAPSLTPEEVMAKASPRLDSLSSFHFKLEQKGGGTPIAMDLEMTGVSGDIIPPDKLKMDISATWGRMNVDSALVTTGTTTFMENPINGNWEPLIGDFQAVTLFKPDTGIRAVMESVTDLVPLEPQKAGGVLCFHMKGIIASEALDAIAVGHAAEGLSVDVEFWIGIEDFLLRKVVFYGRITRDENDGIIRTLTISKFDEPVTIELPNPEGR